jgi:phage repressor protein C with HTH and peptisase S24 domain
MDTDFITCVIFDQHTRIVMITDVDTIAERLKHARALKGWTQTQLAVASGVSQGTIGNIESGARQALASLVPIAEALGINYKWLAHNEGSMLTAERPEPVYLVNNPEFPAVRRVKLRLRAGVTGFAVDSDEDDEAAPIVFRREWFDRNGYKPEKLLAVRVRGNSMEPGLFDGDTVVINTAKTEPIDGAVFAVNYEGESVIKRLVRDGGQWWLSSDNPDQSRHPRKSTNGASILIGLVVHKQSERI